MNQRTLIVICFVGALMALVIGVLLLRSVYTPDDTVEPTAWNPIVDPVNVENGADNSLVRPTDKIIPASPGYRRSDALSFAELVPQEPKSPELQVMLDRMFQDVYYVINCPDTTPPSATVYLNMRYGNQPGYYSLEEFTATVMAWKPLILNDIGHLLYPNSEVPPQRLQFRSLAVGGEESAAAFVDEQQVDVLFELSENQVTIAGSEECYEKLQDMLDDHE